MYHLNMIQTLSITKAREDLPTLVENAKSKLDEYVITVNGSPAAVIVSAAEYESWKETNEILADPGLMKAIREGEKDVKEGRLYSWEKVKKELGLQMLHDVSNNTYSSSKKRAIKNKKRLQKKS